MFAQYHHFDICDMIKGSESDVENIDFELQAKRGDKLLCFVLFLKLKNCSYLRNQISDWDGIWIEMCHFNGSQLAKMKKSIRDMSLP